MVILLVISSKLSFDNTQIAISIPWHSHKLVEELDAKTTSWIFDFAA